VLMSHFGYVPPHAGYSQAKHLVEEALALAPELAAAHATRGWIEAFHERSWDRAERSFERARALSPKYATAWEWSGIFEMSRARGERALEYLREAHRLDPLSLMIQTINAWAHFELGHDEEARRLIRAVGRLDPKFVFALNLEGLMLSAVGDDASAIERLERSTALSGREGLSLAFLGFAHGRAGHSAEAREIVQELRAASSERYVAPFHVALPLLGVGELDEGLRWLKQSIDGGDSFVISIHHSKLLEVIHAEPRYQEMMRGIGAP